MIIRSVVHLSGLLTGACFAATYKRAEHRMLFIFLMNSVELLKILVERNKENSKGSPQVSHSFEHKWKLVTVSNSYPRDKNPPLTVCWRGQWLKEQAPLMSTNLLLMGERGGKSEKNQMNVKTNKPSTMSTAPCFRNILEGERVKEKDRALNLAEP